MYEAINGEYGQDNLPPRGSSRRSRTASNYRRRRSSKRAAVGDAVVGHAPSKSVLERRRRGRPRRAGRATSPTWRRCCSARSPGAWRWTSDEALDSTSGPPATPIKLAIFIVVTTLATALLAITIGNVSLRRDQELQGGLHRRHRRGQGRRRPGRRREGRHRLGRRDRQPHPGPGGLHRRGRDRGHREHLRHDPLPQPGRPALHRADRGRGRRRRARARATRSRSTAPRRRST